MAHMVICFYCKQKFDRDKFESVVVSPRRYAHKECANGNILSEGQQGELTPEQKDLKNLENYIMKLFSEDCINIRVRKQINEYKENYNYTYSGMLKTLIYWYEIKGNSIEKANGGIGIIPFIYKEACDYYYALYMAQLINKEKNIDDYKPKEKIIEIFSPKATKSNLKFFQIEENKE